MLLEVIGMAVRAGMIFAALSLAKTSPHRRPDGCFGCTCNLVHRDCLGGVKLIAPMACRDEVAAHTTKVFVTALLE